MTEENIKESNDKEKLQKPVQKQARRSRLHPVNRYLIIASWGVIIAGAVSYLLKELGY